MPVNKRSSTDGAPTLNALGNAGVLWDDDFLYVRVEVTKNSPLLAEGTQAHLHDSVEVFLSEQNFKGAYSTTQGNQYRVNFLGASSQKTSVQGWGTGGTGQANNHTSGTDISASLPEGQWGYVVTFRIPFRIAEVVKQPGTVFGFDVQINAMQGTSRTCFAWSDDTDSGYNSSANWGELTLASAPVVEPLAAPVMNATTDTRYSRTNRNMNFAPVEGATGYNVYVFASQAGTSSLDNAVAVSRNVPGTVSGANRVISVRDLQFVNLGGADMIRDFNALYPGGVVAGLGISTIGNQGGFTTNLKPGHYWFMVTAVDSTGSYSESPLPALAPTIGQGFSINIGPTEFAAEFDKLLAEGKVVGRDIFIVDVRTTSAGNWSSESADEGHVRFTNVLSSGGAIVAGVSGAGATLDSTIFVY